MVRPSEIHAAMATLMGWFEPGEYAVADCERLITLFAELERMAGYGKGLCMRRVADSRVHRRRGDRSPSAGLGKAAGVDPAEAAAALRRARKAAEGAGAADDAARKGRVSLGDAADAADAADGDPDLEKELVDTTIKDGPKAGREAAARARQAASVAADRARAERIRGSRRLRHWVDRDGCGQLRWTGNPVELGELLAAVHPFALASGEANQAKAAADGLVGLARAAGAVAPSVKNGRTEPAIRIDGSALTRGWAEPDEMCEVVGLGPVPVALVRDALAAGARLVTLTREAGGGLVGYADHGRLGDGLQGAVVVLCGLDHTSAPSGPAGAVGGVLDDLDALTGLANRLAVPIGGDTGTRTATVAQRRALRWLRPRCAHPNCDAVHGLEADHEVPWHQMKSTELPNLTLRCPHHHRHKTRHDVRTNTTARARTPRRAPTTPVHDGTLPLVC